MHWFSFSRKKDKSCSSCGNFSWIHHLSAIKIFDFTEVLHICNAKWYNYQLSLWVLVIQICDRILAQCVTFPATRAFYHQLRTTCNFWLFYNSVIIWTVLRENTCFFHSVATVIGKPQKFQITKLPTEIYCLRILTKKYSFTSANIHFPKNTTQEKNTQCGNFRSFSHSDFGHFF